MSAGVVIVGGGPAAKAAIAGYRDAGGQGALHLLAAEPHLPYKRPPLTKGFLRGETERADLDLECRAWYEERGVEVHLETRIEALDVVAREVRSADGQSWDYDRCLLATGARAARPEVPGIDSPGIHTIRTIEDSMRISAAARDGQGLIVVGSGFIGCELAASAAMRGARVTVVTAEDGPQAERLGPEVAEILGGWLAEMDVEVRADATVETFGSEDGHPVVRAGGEDVRADAAALALGITRNVELADDAGLEGADGILCDESMRTSADGVFAAGDVAEATNAITGRTIAVEHWGEALAQGEVAGRAMAGEYAEWSQAPSFWSTIGERTIKFVGWGGEWDDCELTRSGDGFVARYRADGELVGVLAHDDDEAYERGRDEIEAAGARA